MGILTKKPSGLQIIRDGDRYVFKWKQSVAYDEGQLLFYKYKGLHTWSAWEKIDVSKTDTSKSVTIDSSLFYPKTSNYLTKVQFKVRGNSSKVVKGKNPGWSASTYCDLYISLPNRPMLSYSKGSDENSGEFRWTVTDKASAILTDVEYQSILTASDTTDGASLRWSAGTLGWQSGTGRDSDSITITETVTIDENRSYVRWVRARSRGPRGASDWVYLSHVYAYPPKAQIIGIKASDNTSSGTDVIVHYRAAATRPHPVSSATAQYVVTTPGAGVSVPAEAFWKDGFTAAGFRGGNESVRFTVDTQAGEDTCLFLRIKTVNGSNQAMSAPVVGVYGKLKAPTLASVEVDTGTNKATITATNNSQVSDSRLAVIISLGGNTYTLGVIEHGETSITVSCPDLTQAEGYTFGVYAFAGSYIQSTYYSVSAQMVSDPVWKNGSVPKAPKNVRATVADNEGSILVAWDWTWVHATGAVISWAKHKNAWESTEEPATYTVSNLHQSKWYITGLETGRTWYVRVRLTSGSGDETTNGPWSDAVSIDLSSAPAIPTLVLSDTFVLKGGEFTASWGYTTTDGTLQAAAEICEVAIAADGSITYGDIISHASTQQSVDITTDNWDIGTHYLACRVASASGKTSDGWSTPVAINIVEPISIALSSSSLKDTTVAEDGGTRLILSLTELPLTVKITGAGAGGTTIAVIERASDYHVIRPDESEMDGYEGETIAQRSQTGEGEISIGSDDIIGRLDDGAEYRLVATIKDVYGQTDTVDCLFEVHWTHQAVTPAATVVSDADKLITTITPVKPEGASDTDVCDIYRLSTDAPELIVQGGSFGTSYVDPYPTLGENGGHRVVLRTANGDYITEDNTPAWVDLGADEGDNLELHSIVIDFDGYRAVLPYNVKLDNSWNKDFQETRYLGGSVVGDWNPGVKRRLSASTDYHVSGDNDETIQTMRRLADYPGICHVRTPDGSSFAADVQVSENWQYSREGIPSFNLTITRVDTEGFDGVTIAEWNATQEE